MPLREYGVAVGSLVSFTRDPQHNFGSWYHGHIALNAGGVEWESALDVDAPQAVGVAYRLVTGLQIGDLGPVGALPDGWTPLLHTSASGALDYVRSPALRDGFIVQALRRAFARSAPPDWKPPPADLGLPGGSQGDEWAPPPFPPGRVDSLLESARRIPMLRWGSFPWIDSSGDNALDALKPHLEAARRVYVFGEHYEDGSRGVHDVHMNQGDPAGSQWFTSNGTWQDGGVACQGSDGSVVVWQVRFKTQSLNTDSNGHPA